MVKHRHSFDKGLDINDYSQDSDVGPEETQVNNGWYFSVWCIQYYH